MPDINILASEISDLIAAGEVVERPASIVKELAENSMDAGASRITVEIKDGGVSFIRITDDGCGMDKKDAELCFLRHATSKLKTAEDLFNIGTMGFRGEALAAICAVSKIELLTRKKGCIDGTKVSAQGGRIISVEPAGCPEGTTVVVRELFYNTPARQKFLKKEVTESAAVGTAVDRAALSRPDISFNYIKDGRNEIKTPGTKLIDAVKSVLGRDFAERLAPCQYSSGGITVSGFVGLPEHARPNRGMQYFFINGRYIKSRILSAALEEALKNSILTERFPVCVMHIDILAREVDVNVHPAKIEAKFGNEKALYDTVFFAVKNAIFGRERRPEFSLTPGASRRIVSEQYGRAEKKEQVMFGTQGAADTRLANHLRTKPASTPFLEGVMAGEFDRTLKISDNNFSAAFRAKPISYRGIDLPEPESYVTSSLDLQIEKTASNQGNTEIKTPEFRLAGQIYNLYILIELEDELLIIDKHAAQERIRYEELKRRESGEMSQMLIEPVLMRLGRLEHDAVISSTDTFTKLGFLVEDFGGDSLMLRGVPVYLDLEAAKESVVEIADMIIENKRQVTPKVYDDILHSIACKASVRAGERSTEGDMRALAERLLALPDIRYCPHGRPVAMSLKKSAIDKQFKR